MRSIYLDNNSTTPLDSRVLDQMLPYLQNHFGNAASASHQWGWAAEAALKKSRHQVAELLNAKDNEIFFTSGATESNNWVIFGLLRQWRAENPQAPVHIISTNIEHESVRQPLLAAMAQLHIEVDFVAADMDGLVHLKDIQKFVRPHTRLISVIWAQNEIGTIQPIQEIARFAKEQQIYFHTDATQAVGKISVDVQLTDVDLLSASAHKFYGPKGIGFLYVRSQQPKVQLAPLLYGGGQERGLRSGTSNVAGIVGLGAAAEICRNEFPEEFRRTQQLRDLLLHLLQKEFPQLRVNGSLQKRTPVNLNVTLQGFSLDELLPHLPRMAVSFSSACNSGTWNHSPILQALGLKGEQIQSSLRLSLGRETQQQDILDAVDIFKKALKKQ